MKKVYEAYGSRFFAVTTETLLFPKWDDVTTLCNITPELNIEGMVSTIEDPIDEAFKSQSITPVVSEAHRRVLDLTKYSMTDLVGRFIKIIFGREYEL